MLADLIVRVPWMKYYKGPSFADTQTKDGSFAAPSDSWGEYAYNYLTYQGVLLGCFDPGVGHGSDIDVERLGAPKGADMVNGVSVWWVSYYAQKGYTTLVGWHREATVYKRLQPPPGDPHRKLPNGQLCGFYTKAEVRNCVLIREAWRVSKISMKPDLPWQGNIVYQGPKDHHNEVFDHFSESVREYRLGKHPDYYE